MSPGPQPSLTITGLVTHPPGTRYLITIVEPTASDADTGVVREAIRQALSEARKDITAAVLFEERVVTPPTPDTF